ncbi:hypothetical protein MGSAQ_000420 [marine sediment metagenome]|uniref:Uncharacterized protein n=1 Tax=marine sediment metagenome TaxID=412755 RepID=A0A1B6NXA8_9ZZZZ
MPSCGHGYHARRASRPGRPPSHCPTGCAARCATRRDPRSR